MKEYEVFITKKELELPESEKEKCIRESCFVSFAHSLWVNGIKLYLISKDMQEILNWFYADRYSTAVEYASHNCESWDSYPLVSNIPKVIVGMIPKIKERFDHLDISMHFGMEFSILIGWIGKNSYLLARWTNTRVSRKSLIAIDEIKKQFDLFHAKKELEDNAPFFSLISFRVCYVGLLFLVVGLLLSTLSRLTAYGGYIILFFSFLCFIFLAYKKNLHIKKVRQLKQKIQEISCVL